jgi:cytoskeletal protein RodZ
MSVPQMKEGPASMLRAMFAGFGSVMSVMDKIRSKPAAEAPADAGATAPRTPEAPAAAATETTAERDTVAAETTADSATTAEPDASAEPDAVVAETTTASDPTTQRDTPVEPVAVVAHTTTQRDTPVEPFPVVAESAAAPNTAAAPDTAAALPLANYEELTVASLRARLRNLSNDDLTRLKAYEQAHQNRPEVIKMFQNRLIKMTTGLQKLES